MGKIEILWNPAKTRVVILAESDTEIKKEDLEETLKAILEEVKNA